MDRPRHTFSSLDELRQIQSEARQSPSLDQLRRQFDRIQALRRAYVDDFDLQMVIAEVQDEIVERGRLLRQDPADAGGSVAVNAEANSEAAEIPPDVQRLDTKTWQKALYLALFFTIIVLAGFFYLVQTARKLNFTQDEAATQQGRQTSDGKSPAVQQAVNPVPAPSTNPTVRLYTDLIPGTVSVDEGPAQDLKDGEIVLDNLQPGQHSLKVTGRSGNAAFSFDVAEKSPPRVIGLPTTSNAMAVLVSEQDGRGHLITNAEHSEVLLDGKPAGEVGADGLTLEDLGKTDHDLQVTENKDRQRFVLTYTAAPALTVYVKSDPNAGTMVVITGQDGVDVVIDDKPYRRKTDRGQVRIPLKVGQYTIRVHKAGFIDPPPQSVDVKKAEEAAVQFRMQPAPEIATLDIKGALPGTMVYIDKDFAALVSAEGDARISNVKPGDHIVELRRDQALPKRFERTFRTGEVAVLTGSDVVLDRVVTDNKTAPPPAPAPPPVTAPAAESGNSTQNSMEIPGEQVRRGNGVGFVPYSTPRVPGRYSFQAQARVGGFFKHGKLQWYAGYQDSQNYVLFTLDGKHATIHEVRNGKSTEVNRVPFNVDSNAWVQVDLSVKAKSIDARVKTPGTEWSEVGAVSSADRDFTQGRVGLYIPGNEAVAVSDFRFSNH